MSLAGRAIVLIEGCSISFLCFVNSGSTVEGEVFLMLMETVWKSQLCGSCLF